MKKTTYKKDIGKKPKITCETDARDIRIYINDILHIIIPRPSSADGIKDSFFLQSYLTGTRKRKFYYIEVQHERGSDYYLYDDFEIWKEILKLLDENI